MAGFRAGHRPHGSTEKRRQAADGVADLPIQVKGLEQMRGSAERLRHKMRFTAIAWRENPRRKHSTKLRGIPLNFAVDVQKHADITPLMGSVRI